MTSNLGFFSNLDENQKENIYLADGRTLITAGKGEGQLRCQNDANKVRDITVKDVLYVPELHGNLLSVKRLLEKGLEVNFSEKQCVITKHGQVIAVAAMRNSLYMLETTCQRALTVKDKSLCVHEWHKILGHRDIQAIKNLEDKELATGIKIRKCSHEDKCSTCVQGKMTKISFPKKSNTETTDILELIHTDLCGPVNIVTPGGNRYILTLIDDYSRYTHIYLLKNKSETSGKIIEFVKQMQTTFGKTPKCFRSDRGGEYLNEVLDEFFKNEGIKRQTSAPYTPEQNGTAERKNRYLIEMTRCLLLESGLDKKFWGEAVHNANFLQNRLPTRRHGRTPYEKWHKELPNLERIRTFGTQAFTLVPDCKRHKLDDKASKMIFVGYEDGSKAYRLLNTTTNRIVISRHVHFLNESEESTNTSDVIPSDICQESPELGIQEESMVYVDITENHTAEPEQQELHDEQSNPVRRSARTTKGQPPERLIQTINIATEDSIEPKSYKEATTSKESLCWKAAMNQEMESLKECGTFELTELPANKDAIGNKWVYKKKLDENGKVNRYKARLVAQGYSQKFGEEYDEVFAPVVCQTTFRTLLTVAGKKKMYVKHYDIQTAYLNGDLHHEVYMKQPAGYIQPGKEHLVCKLKKNLYGLKQGANEGNRKLNDSLLGIGFQQSKSDPCLYSKKSRGFWMYILVYVDDVVASCELEANLTEFESQLQAMYQIKNLGDLKYYLGLHIDRDDQGVFYLHQTNYIKHKLKEFGLADSKPSRIPLEPGYMKRNEVEDPFENNDLYRSAIGSLLYVSTNTRPDISVSTSILASKVSQPKQSDWTEVKRIFRYLKTTLGKRLMLGSNLSNEVDTLEGYVDANWAGDHTERKSNSGYIFQLYGGTISWSSKRQQSVALSSAEAEYVALAEATQEAIWLERLLIDFNEKVGRPITMFEDNQSCIKMLDGKFSQRTKHIDIKYHFVQDLVKENVIHVKYCPTEHMIADIMTKPLEAVKTAKFVKSLGLYSTDKH